MFIEQPTIELPELSALADVSQRTIRYYIQQGLLPSPESRGPGARYGPEHLDRLKLIKALQREHLPLAEIRRRIESLGPAEVRRLAELASSRQPTSAKDAVSASSYIRSVLSGPAASMEPHQPLAALHRTGTGGGKWRGDRSQWDRVVLARDVELHVRRPLSREQNRQVERLIDAARNIFDEEEP